MLLYYSAQYLTLNLTLILKKIDPKTGTFKNLEQIQKTWKKFLKIIWPHC